MAGLLTCAGQAARSMEWARRLAPKPAALQSGRIRREGSGCGSIVDQPGVPAPETLRAARPTGARCAVVAYLAERDVPATRGQDRTHRYGGEALDFTLVVAGPMSAVRSLVTL